jgi:hypothetical protein
MRERGPFGACQAHANDIPFAAFRLGGAGESIELKLALMKDTKATTELVVTRGEQSNWPGADLRSHRDHR